jgi:hypothetical protein
MTPNPKIRELIMNMGIIPESEHYDIAEQVIRECAELMYGRDENGNCKDGDVIKQHFGVEE